ncbi:histidine phosphatase family protein [Alteromonas sp. 5E99-2]|uniref:histidine phosphatase family protein n=1 Tax=Alteromonas sp. 5E99-2 TaxID=2817683 RepID=UPI001A990F22|nr:histidine phosphatase family protein [Alteromonas sp. 5E99-2]MBO1254577.1 histidine phosphatase family protein [Alteromonas sp. 5E99-2]
MNIILIRHGEPVSATNERVDAIGFAYWVKRYNHSDVLASSRPHWPMDKQLSEAYLVSSSLKRAKQSAFIAFDRQPSEYLSNFREMDIPRYLLPFTLKTWTWVYLSRLLWMLGKKGKFESYSEAKTRVKDSADYLISLAEKHGTVAAVGHGFSNLHIRKYLVTKGWQLSEKDNGYWGISKLDMA